MSVKLRFKRLGRKNRPFYRLVAIDSRSRRDGREIEKLGWYDPIKSDLSLEFDEDRLVHWLDQGAIPSDTLKTLLKKKGRDERKTNPYNPLTTPPTHFQPFYTFHKQTKLFHLFRSQPLP